MRCQQYSIYDIKYLKWFVKFYLIDVQIARNLSLDFLLISGNELAAHLDSVMLLVLGAIS